MGDSVFTKWLKGKTPGLKLYEDELTAAFLDHNPLSKGHTLVIPKQQIDHLEDCPAELYAAVFETVRKLSAHLTKTLKPMRIALVVHGMEVPHAHVHVVPMYTGNELHLADRTKRLIPAEEVKRLARELQLR